MPRIPPKGRPIQKGERRNPNGSSAKARGIAAMKRAHKTMTPDQLAQLMSLFMNGTPEQMMTARNDPEATVITKLVAKFLTTAHDKADMQIFRTLLEFTVGRPRERKSHEVSGPDGGPIPTAQQSDEEMLAELKRLRAAREAAEKAGE